MNDEQRSQLEAIVLDNRADYEEAIQLALGSKFKSLSADDLTALTNLMQATVKLSVLSAAAVLGH